MSEVEIANGCAKAPKGSWLVGCDQPVASAGAVRVRAQRGFVVPDRASLFTAEADGEIYCSSSDRPFLTRLDAPPDGTVSVVSRKVLVAPRASRRGSRGVKLVPLSFRRATTVTDFTFGWVVAAKRGRVTRVAVEEAGTLSVLPEALVAWIGKDPTGFCPRLGVFDLLLPRGPKNLVYSFHGPCVVWFEGSSAPERVMPRMGVR